MSATHSNKRDAPSGARPQQPSKSSAPTSRAALLSQLDARLTALRADFEAQGNSMLFAFAGADPAAIDAAFRRTGVVGVANVATEDDAASMRQGVAAAAVALHQGRVAASVLRGWLADVKTIDSDTHRRGKGANGVVWGNCAFGFVFGQKNSADSPLVASVAGASTLFEKQPGHKQTVAWLEARPPIADLVLALGALDGCAADGPLMVSWDSIKYVYDAFAGTRKTLTQPHVDLYSETTDMHRRQMAIEISAKSPGTGRARRLCYVPFTNHPDIQTLLARIDKRYGSARDGFVSLHDDGLWRVLFTHAVSFDSYHLAMWADGVVHFEAFAEPDPRRPGLCRVQDRALVRGEKLECMRAIVGTHRATLGKEALAKFNVMADSGFLMSLYRRKQHSAAAQANLMCAKSTQFHTVRSVLPAEVAEFRAADATDVDAAIGAWSATKRRLYGVAE